MKTNIVIVLLVILVCVAFRLGQVDAIGVLPINRSTFTTPALKATWDTISVPTFEPNYYPTNVSDICYITSLSSPISGRIYNYGSGVVSYPSCNGVIYATDTSTLGGDSLTLLYLSGTLTLSGSISLTGLVILPGGSIVGLDKYQIEFISYPDSFDRATYDPQGYFPGVVSYGGTLSANAATPRYLGGSATSSNSISVSNGVASTDVTSTDNFTLYSQSYPNGQVVTYTSYDTSSNTFTFSGLTLDTTIDTNVYITMASKLTFYGQPYNIFTTNGGTLNLKNLAITGGGRTSNVAYSCTNPVTSCANPRARSPVYFEFSSVTITGCLFANPSGRADIIAHHGSLVAQNNVFLSNTGSSILAEWGTESITSTGNVFIKSMPTSQPSKTPSDSNMDYGYTGTGITSISPNIISNNDYFYSKGQGFVGIYYQPISNRAAVTGIFFDYSIPNNNWIYSNQTTAKLDITGDRFNIINGSPMSIQSANQFAPIQVKGISSITSVTPITLSTNSEFILVDNFNSPNATLKGSVASLTFSNSQITSLDANFISLLNPPIVRFETSYLLNNSVLPSSFKVADDRYQPITSVPLTLSYSVSSVTKLPVYQPNGTPLAILVSFSDSSSKTCQLLKTSPETQLLNATGTSSCTLNYNPFVSDTDYFINLQVKVYDSSSSLVLAIPLGKLLVLTANNKFYHGISLDEKANSGHVNDTFVLGQDEQWSLCTSTYYCNDDPMTASGLTDLTKAPYNSTYNETSPYVDLYQNGYSLSLNPSVTMKNLSTSYYAFSLNFIYSNNFIPWSENNLVVPTSYTFTITIGDQIKTISLNNDQVLLSNVTLVSGVTSDASSLSLSVSGPSYVYFTSFSIYSVATPPDYLIYPSPTSPVEPGKSKSFPIVAVVVPVVVVVVLGGGLILFFFWRKRNQRKNSGPISPLKMGTLGQSGGLKSSVSGIPTQPLVPGSPEQLQASQSRNNLLTASFNFRTSTNINEDKYRVDPTILSFTQESHYYPCHHADFPLTFANTQLDFGLGGTKCPIDQIMSDNVVCYNKTKKPLNITILLPTTSNTHITETQATTFTIKPGRSHTIEINVKLLCTTKYMEKFAIHIENFGHTYLFMHLESVLSTKLDYSELELVQPPIGEGSFGIVYRGHWRGQEVAVKQMKVGSINMDEVYREMDLMSKLRHPNIISFIGAVMTSEHLCIVSEFVPLGSLGDYIYKSGKKLHIVQKIRIALDIAKGCNFLHQCGIIHRDLKPDNILIVSLAVDAPISIKISDFGTSKEAAELDYAKYTNAVGTPIYMSNQVLEKKDYDNSTDVYSYAIMFYELLIEEIPFSEVKNMWDIPRYVIAGKRPQKGLDQMDPVLVKLISECWSQDSTQRPSFKELIPRLEEILDTYKAKHIMTSSLQSENSFLSLAPPSNTPLPPPIANPNNNNNNLSSSNLNKSTASRPTSPTSTVSQSPKSPNPALQSTNNAGPNFLSSVNSEAGFNIRLYSNYLSPDFDVRSTTFITEGSEKDPKKNNNNNENNV